MVLWCCHPLCGALVVDPDATPTFLSVGCRQQLKKKHVETAWFCQDWRLSGGDLLTIAIVIPCELVVDGVEKLSELFFCDLAISIRVKLGGRKKIQD